MWYTGERYPNLTDSIVIAKETHDRYNRLSKSFDLHVPFIIVEYQSASFV